MQSAALTWPTWNWIPSRPDLASRSARFVARYSSIWPTCLMREAIRGPSAAIRCHQSSSIWLDLALMPDGAVRGAQRRSRGQYNVRRRAGRGGGEGERSVHGRGGCFVAVGDLISAHRSAVLSAVLVLVLVLMSLLGMHGCCRGAVLSARRGWSQRPSGRARQRAVPSTCMRRAFMPRNPSELHRRLGLHA